MFVVEAMFQLLKSTYFSTLFGVDEVVASISNMLVSLSVPSTAHPLMGRASISFKACANR